MHNGFLPREGFRADSLIKIIRNMALNPALLLPLVLLARFTKKGQDLAILHPTALSRIKTLLWLGAVGRMNSWLSDKAVNNWVDDKYDWKNKEIVLITGGAGGIGGIVAQLFAEQGVKVVVLDIQPLTYPAGMCFFF